MKKIIFNMFFVGLISIMVLPLCVSAKSISTLETSATNGKITVSGTTESGVLAIATLVYSEDDLVYMETCEANGTAYSCTLNNTFAKGKYTIKVADYNGGNYIIKETTVSGTNQNNPKTFDGIIFYVGLGIFSIIILTGVFLYIKKKKIQ